MYTRNSTYTDKATKEFFIFSSAETITKSSDGNFLYEKDNHLGNVMVVLSDLKKAVDDGTYSGGVKINSTPDGITDFYQADVLAAYDYYSGVGQLMPGRVFESVDYRYGAQGSEVVKEIGGDRNNITTFYREGNLELLRWNSPDPKTDPSESPYAMNRNNGVRYNDPKGDCPPGVDCGAKASLSLTFGTKGQSRLNFAVGLGASKTSGSFMGGANLSLNLYSGGPGTSQASTGQSSFGGALTLGLSGTFGSGAGSGRPTGLNIFNSSTQSGITNTFESSGTIGTNLTYNNATGFNRAWGVAGKTGGFTATLNEDFSFAKQAGRGILGSGYDEGETGGGFLGYTFKNGTSIFAGTEIFTGKPFGGYPKTGDGTGYVLQSETQQQLNVGRSFLKIENAPGIGNLRFDYSGSSQMWSQNLIHDALGYDRFKSTAVNSFQITR